MKTESKADRLRQMREANFEAVRATLKGGQRRKLQELAPATQERIEKVVEKFLGPETTIDRKPAEPAQPKESTVKTVSSKKTAKTAPKRKAKAVPKARASKAAKTNARTPVTGRPDGLRE